jgi:hypothetical protein
MIKTEKILPNVPEDLADVVTKEIESLIYISDTLKRAKEVDYSEMAEVIGGIESYQKKQTAIGVYAMLEAVMIEVPPVTDKILRQVTRELNDENCFVDKMIERLKDDNFFVQRFIGDRVVKTYETLKTEQSAMASYKEARIALVIYRLIEVAEEEKLKTGSGGH